MGMLYEDKELQKEVCEMLVKSGYYPVLSTEINATTDLSMCVRPLSFDILLNGKNIVSCNCPENAITIYHALRADFKGEVYHG